VHIAAIGPSRLIAVPCEFGRFRCRADISSYAVFDDLVESDPQLILLRLVPICSRRLAHDTFNATRRAVLLPLRNGLEAAYRAFFSGRSALRVVGACDAH
jgi:hypothetical protein